MPTLSDAPLALAIYEPEIPANAGAIARLCAATATPLHFIGRLGFSFRHPAAKRAGMDYWEQVELQRHVTYADFLAANAGVRIRPFSTRAKPSLWETTFGPGDILLFGPESRGLPDEILAAHPADAVRIPMAEAARSLNLATAAAVAVYEALRQLRSGA